MESNTSIKHYRSREDYLLNRGMKSAKKVASAAKKGVGEAIAGKSEVGDAHKVELSEKTKKKASSVKEQIKSDGKEIAKAGSHLVGDALGVIATAVPSPFPNKLPSIEISQKSKVINTEIRELGPINKPAIIFLSGLELGSVSSNSRGLAELSEAVRGSEHFSWKDEDKVLEEILRRPDHQPIVLIGHSLGGDAAVNLANQLNTLKGGFKEVDLLVTLDSVGFDNDIIPGNVKKNINFISDEDYFFNDGPNIARDIKKTNVVNFLRPDKHTEIDEANEVHFEVISGIKEVIEAKKENNKFQKLTDLFNHFSKSKNSK